MDLKGKTKKLLAILAALGITAAGVTDALNHIMATFPSPKLHVICSGVITVIGLLVAVFPVSVKAPDPQTPAESAGLSKSAQVLAKGLDVPK